MLGLIGIIAGSWSLFWETGVCIRAVVSLFGGWELVLRARI